jgi:hypothetical protein
LAALGQFFVLIVGRIFLSANIAGSASMFCFAWVFVVVRSVNRVSVQIIRMRKLAMTREVSPKQLESKSINSEAVFGTRIAVFGCVRTKVRLDDQPSNECMAKEFWNMPSC